MVVIDEQAFLVGHLVLVAVVRIVRQEGDPLRANLRGIPLREGGLPLPEGPAMPITREVRLSHPWIIPAQSVFQRGLTV